MRASRRILAAWVAALTLVATGVGAEIPTAPAVGGDQACQLLTPDTFDDFIAAPVALFQVHHGSEVLAAEIAEAQRRMPAPIPYATLDASDAGNAGVLAKLDRGEGAATAAAAPEFFVFRHGLPYDKLPRLRAGLSPDAVEEVLLYVTLESTRLADAEAPRKGPDGEDFPLWSVYHGRDNFEEVLTAERFDELMAASPASDINIVQFFSRWCKYCQLFSFEWHKVANEFSMFDRVNFLRVDGNTVENEPLLERFGVTGFPAVKFFHGPKYDSTYTGERTAASLKPVIMEALARGASERRNPDGSYNIGANMPTLMRNLKAMYTSGALSEAEYLDRQERLQRGASVTE